MTKIRFESVARWLILPLLIGAFAVPTAGCARRARRGVVRIVARQMNCSPHQLQALPMGNHRWNVSGCGQQAVYQCYRAPYVGYRCNPVGGPTQTVATTGGQVAQAPPPAYAQTSQPQPQPAPAPQPAAQAWTPELGQQIFNQSAPHVLACVPAPTPISLNLEYGTDGRVARVGGIEQFPAPQQTCLTSALQYAAVPGGLAQAVVVPFRFR